MPCFSRQASETWCRSSGGTCRVLLKFSGRVFSLTNIFREVENSVTAPRGFRAGGLACGIKSDAGSKDLALLIADVPCVAAGTFTTSKTAAAPVKVCQSRLQDGQVQAIIVNSGNANCATGELGLQNAYHMTEYVAQRFALAEELVL